MTYLEQHQGGATWMVAVGSANESAPLQLASGRPVMAMGGFSGGDPALSVSRLQELVGAGKLRYVLLAGGGGFSDGPAGDSQAQARDAWIVQHGRQVTVPGSGGVVLYDLAATEG